MEVVLMWYFCHFVVVSLWIHIKDSKFFFGGNGGDAVTEGLPVSCVRSWQSGQARASGRQPICVELPSCPLSCQCLSGLCSLKAWPPQFPGPLIQAPGKSVHPVSFRLLLTLPSIAPPRIYYFWKDKYKCGWFLYVYSIKVFNLQRSHVIFRLIQFSHCKIKKKFSWDLDMIKMPGYT